MDFKQNIPLTDKNWFGTGGPASVFCQPTDADDFKTALHYARDNNLDIFVLGEGANILVSDDGFDGLVINPVNASCEISQHPREDDAVLIRAGAGGSFQTLIDFSLKHNVRGLEEFSGIPGTIGGAIYINIHYFDHLLSQFLVSARVIDRETLEIHDVPNEWFGFGYDISRLHAGSHILVDACFILKKSSELETAYAWGRRDEIIRHRERRYPADGTCGSFFQNFSIDEVLIEERGERVIYVAYYLDKVGIKGTLAAGDAVVSHKHANMIINRGSATSADIVNLARQMQEKVRDAFGLIPRPECQLVGFSEYPLLKE
jgi:UDP-N-acetylmuramate dehydrogenase